MVILCVVNKAFKRSILLSSLNIIYSRFAYYRGKMAHQFRPTFNQQAPGDGANCANGPEG